VACKLISDTRKENYEIARIVMITQKRVATWMKSTAWHESLRGILSLISKKLPSRHVKNSAYEIFVKL